jgi:microcin C transport system substrate-binding protein
MCRRPEVPLCWRQSTILVGVRESSPMRTILSVVLLAVSVAAGHAQEPVWRHATSLIEEPKYAEGFAHFDYVNPDAPKGGTVRLPDTGTFDTLNAIAPTGSGAAGLGLIYETLMTTSMDEVSTQYGLIAEAVSYPDDYSSVTYRLNAAARWHDGEPITVDDVIWSFETQVAINPSIQLYYQNVVSAEQTGENEVTFTFDVAGNRELPHIVGELLVLPRHYWEGTNAAGRPRDITASTLEPPLGSGPYRVASVSPGRTIIYERVPDYWGENLPVNIGQNNFDQIRYETFLDETVSFEGFKADLYDWRLENQARRWATAYNFPAVLRGDVVQEEFENPYRDNGVMVGFVPNLRRPLFQDVLVRRALNYAFDFETMRRTIFFDQYDRIDSFFFGTPLASTGLPEGKELEILQSVADLVPPEVFTTPYVNPVGGSPENERENLRAAIDLLRQAGYELDGSGRLVNPQTGQQLAFEVLLNGPTIEPVALAYQSSLRKIGIEMSIRSVDTPQWIERIRSRDFDVTYTAWAQSLSPGNEQRDFWGSAAADSESSRNYTGIKDPGVDALIDRIILATDRDELIATTHALDRVLLANQYVIPSYTLSRARIGRWDRFSRPETLPEFSIGFPTIWWWNAERAAQIGGGSAQ